MITKLVLIVFTILIMGSGCLLIVAGARVLVLTVEMPNKAFEKQERQP